MSFERWGSLSVVDHVDTEALIANVLLYDRLVIPVCTEQADRDERAYWVAHGWDPDLQLERLKQLGDRAVPRPWDDGRRTLFRTRMDELTAERFDARHIDDKQITRMILAKEQVVERIPGVNEVSVIAAYNSEAGLRGDFEVADEPDTESRADKLAAQAYLLTRRLALPAAAANGDLLNAAAGLSRDKGFREKRTALFDWQETAVARKWGPEAAVAEIAAMTERYNEAVASALGKVRWRFAFTVCGVVLGFAGGGVGVAAASAALSLIQFKLLDGKPAIEPGSAAPAAMFHDVETRLGIKLR